MDALSRSCSVKLFRPINSLVFWFTMKCLNNYCIDRLVFKTIHDPMTSVIIQILLKSHYEWNYNLAMKLVSTTSFHESQTQRGIRYYSKFSNKEFTG